MVKMAAIKCFEGSLAFLTHFIVLMRSFVMIFTTSGSSLILLVLVAPPTAPPLPALPPRPLIPAWSPKVLSVQQRFPVIWLSLAGGPNSDSSCTKEEF